MEKPDPPDEYAAYLAERRAYIEGEVAASREFDRWLLTVSGGALGISMAFTKDFVTDSSRFVVLIPMGWLAFGAAVLAALYSFRLSQRAFEKYRECMDQAFASSEPQPMTRARRMQASVKEASAVDSWNNACVVLFGIGVLVTALFVLINASELGANHG